MGTHAMIGIVNEDGTVTASYCHYDGYLQGVGQTLYLNYNTQYDAEAIAKGGYMSALYSDIVQTRQEAVHKEPAIEYESVSHYFETAADDFGADYLYIWDGEAWFFNPTYTNPGFEEVEMNLKNVKNV